MITKLLVASAFVGTTVAAIFLSWGVEAGSGNEKPQPVAPKKRAFFTGATCYDCHTNKLEFYKDKLLICSLDEFDKWESKDKHRLAFMALKGKLAATIGANLKIPDVTIHKACVVCHSTWIEDEAARKKNQPLIEEGVSCMICHGMDNAVWVGLHGIPVEQSLNDWREHDRVKKEREFGMLDMWDPAKRTQMCVSCHIGSAREGKLLTHDMYAAGHPPLPTFDMSSFSDAMRHWRHMSEKTEDVRKAFKIEPIQIHLEQINLINIGSLVSFRETMLLLKDQASKKDTWPEFAQFDCYSCHHDLKASSWRQKRVPAGKPGRPQVPAWSTALVELALYHSSPPDAAEENLKTFKAKLAKLHMAFDSHTFGKESEITEAAGALVEFINQKINVLEKAPAIDQSIHKRLLVQLMEKQNSTLLDHESARQVAGALRAIYTDGWKKGLSKEVMSQLTLVEDELSLAFNSEARKKFNDIRFGITKELPAMPRKDVPKFFEMKLEAFQDNYNLEMSAYLEKINSYDPERFQKEMRKIAVMFDKLEKP